MPALSTTRPFIRECLLTNELLSKSAAGVERYATEFDLRPAEGLEAAKESSVTSDGYLCRTELSPRRRKSCR
jgi:hypothetical protein